MDEKKINESRARIRDEALARRVGEALDRFSAPGAGECLDGELIAAYHERALQPGEITRCENHFAGCPRCRKILAVLAASADTPLSEKEAARLGELAAVAERASVVEMARKENSVPPNRFDWRVRWLAPALGVAAVLAIWFAVRPPWRAAGPTKNLVAQVQNTEAPQGADARGSDQLSRVEPGKTPETAATIAKNGPLAATIPASPAEKSPESNPLADSKALEKLKARSALDEVVPEEQKKARAEVATETGFDSPSAPAPAMPPPADAAMPLQAGKGALAASPQAAGAISGASGREQQPIAGLAQGASNSTARPAAELAAGGRSDRAISLALDAAKQGEIEIVSPSGKSIWRAGRGGKIQHSADTGRSWTLQESPSLQDWIAGSATSDAVCWLVGTNGAIARTTNAERWTQIASPPVASQEPGKLPDWTGVAASSAQAATITSSDRRRYRTQDGGQTWQLQ